jgi:hypothetical protein
MPQLASAEVFWVYQRVHHIVPKGKLGEFLICYYLDVAYPMSHQII